MISKDEFDALMDVTSKLESIGIDYMLTGSFAMLYYAVPRMTRDIDMVISIKKEYVKALISTFSSEYFISSEAIENAVRASSMFNIIHYTSIVKIDLIIKKDNEYRQTEFERRKKVTIDSIEIFIVSKEDLIISKLIWSKDSKSELQQRDIKNLLKTGYDKNYLENWVKKLGLEKSLKDIKDE